MVSVFLISFYFSCLFGFSLVSQPVVFCILLLMSATAAAGCVYCVVGFSWYLVLFCLVYIGGVYVLFIFVSVHDPNPLPAVGGGGLIIFMIVVSLLTFFVGLVVGVPFFVESSHYLCSFFEGLSYSLFCLILMVGFVSISVVVGSKDSFFR